MAVALLLPVLHAELPDNVVVTAAPPLDSQRLADALRTYLDEFGIHVEVAPATTDGDLRKQLADARQLGEAVRAVAVVRVEREMPGQVELQLINLATDKALVVTVRRPARDEDLYRALALKIQAVLRATLSEARAEIAPESAVGKLVAANDAATSPPPRGQAATPGAVATVTASREPAAAEPADRGRSPTGLALATGYAVVSFPVGGLVFQGVEVGGAVRPERWLELTLGVAALDSVRAEGNGVDAVLSVIPVSAAALLRLGQRRTELLFGPSAALALVSVSPSSTTLPVHVARNVIVGLGAEAEGRVRAWETTWIFARGSALALPVGERYDVSGTPILDTSRFELSAVAGIGVALR